MKIKLFLLTLGVIFLSSCNNIDDNFLTKNKWTDGRGSVFVFDTKGDNGKYNPLVLQNSSVLTRLGNFTIDGELVIIDWTNGNPDWKLKKSGNNLKLILESGEGVTLKPL